MNLNNLTLNRKAAAVTSCDGLNFVFTTTHPALKGQGNVHYHINTARCKPH